MKQIFAAAVIALGLGSPASATAENNSYCAEVTYQSDVSQEFMDAFNKYAGREIAVDKSIEILELSPDTAPLEIPVYDINPSSYQLFQEMGDVLEDHGYSMRVSLPGSFGTADYDPNRVNVRVSQASDGKWRIGCHFGLN